MQQLFSALKQKRYQDVLTAASDLDTADVNVQRSIGISLLRTGRFEEAEPWLLRTYAQGDPEGSVEYANLLRVLGRLQEAIEIFKALSISLVGELSMRCLRWYGVSEFMLDMWYQGISKCDKSRLGYLALGDEESAARISQNLAVMYKQVGEIKKAEKSLIDCINFKIEDDNFRLLSAKTLADLYIETGNLKEAQKYILIGENFLKNAYENNVFQFKATKSWIAEQMGDYENYYVLINDIYEYSVKNNDYSLLLWSSVKMADILSRRGEFSKALKIIYSISGDSKNRPLDISLAKAVLHRRQGDVNAAILELENIRSKFDSLSPNKDSVTALLHLGFAHYIQQKHDLALRILKEALEGLMRLNSHTAFKPVLEEMSELLHYAALEPSLAPYLEPVMDSMADLLSGTGLRGEGEQIRLQVYTFGQVSVLLDGVPIQFSLKGSVALLAYLALRPNRTRTELQLDLYPDKEPEAAGAYVRQSIRELRELLGREVIVREGPHNHPRYRLGGAVQLDLDLERFKDAVEQGKVARALALYRGEFLPGMDESEWVRTRREEAQLSLSFELRNQISHFHEQREWRRLILLSNQYLRIDPYDQEIHELRIEAARRVGNASELARYIAQMNALNN